MSFQYDNYLKSHISNVQKAAEWLLFHFPELLKDVDENRLRNNLNNHDQSKYLPEEYDAYDAYFYGGNKSHKVVSDFNLAWLHHIHQNPHHWQHWVLIHDDEPEEILEMPKEYVIEMIADWWSFGHKSGNLKDIFDWYEQHKDMKLHPKTRKLVEDILGNIKTELTKKVINDIYQQEGVCSYENSDQRRFWGI